MYSGYVKIDKLSDEFGQYEILLTCKACGHTRRCLPHTLAAFATWDAKLGDVVRRIRCTQCDKKQCTAKTMRETAPRGHKSH